jgi:hypothetical protein
MWADVLSTANPGSLNPLVQSGRPVSVKAAQSLGSGEFSLVDRMADPRAAHLVVAGHHFLVKKPSCAPRSALPEWTITS